VTVLEQGDQVGGKMGEVREGGFRFDTGPSVVTMRHVFEDLYATAGTSLADELELVPVEPLTRYRWPSGASLDLSQDLEATLEGIRAIEPRDADGYRRFLEHVRELHRITGMLFIYGPPPTLRTFTKLTPRDGRTLAPWRTLHDSIAAHVRSPELRQLLGRFATYVGADPYRAPSTLGVIAHVELNQGVWYPRGGVHAIARSLGVEIRTGTPVERIETSRGRATGVVVAGGARIAADAVVANVDVATVADRLLAPGVVRGRRLRRLHSTEPSLSGFIVLHGTRESHPELAHHTILFGSDYRREFAELTGRGVPASDPTVYLALTCRTDPADAPAGGENWFVLVNAPPLGPGVDWRAEGVADRYRELVLDRVRAFGIEPGDPAVSRTFTPVDLAERTGAARGALYGPSSSRAMAAFERPKNRDAAVRGLYYVGGTTHPGGGVPMVMLSGRLVASYVGDDLALPPGPTEAPALTVPA
jgi:phytoene desaturase